MGDSIPGEILTSIAAYLSRPDLSTCLHVCRSWHLALTPSLYSSVVIRSQEQLERFTRTLCNTDAKSSLGNLVRQLSLRFIPSHDSLVLLPPLCPFAVEVDVWCDWYPELATVFQEWKYLTTMPEVIINDAPPAYLVESLGKKIRQLVLNIHGYPEWINLMVELPCVEELQVDGICPRWREENAKLSLPGLETALNALPRLRDLDIYNASFYGDLPENIAPCDVAHNLRLRLDNSHLWGHYFSRKYTHLRSLDISPTQDIAAFTSEAKMLVRSCRRLERLEANFSRMRSIYRECLEILKEIGAPLVSLDLDDLDDIDPHEYETLISAFHETVSAIKFTTRERRTAEEITGPLKACRNLTSLRLRCAFSDIELDYCLACCKRLKRLEIAVNTISVAENFTTDYKHGLEKLNIVADDIADDLFPYLLQHCPLLHKLECDYNPKCNRSCDIYIPSPRLAYLRVEYSNNCIFKVTQEAKAEHPSSERSETKSNNQTLWYCQKFDEAVTFRKLDSSEIDRLVGQQCKDDDGCGTEKSERSSKPREPLSSIDGQPVLSITCYSMAQIRFRFADCLVNVWD